MRVEASSFRPNCIILGFHIGEVTVMTIDMCWHGLLGISSYFGADYPLKLIVSNWVNCQVRIWFTKKRSAMPPLEPKPPSSTLPWPFPSATSAKRNRISSAIWRIGSRVVISSVSIIGGIWIRYFNKCKVYNLDTWVQLVSVVRLGRPKVWKVHGVADACTRYHSKLMHSESKLEMEDERHKECESISKKDSSPCPDRVHVDIVNY